jgi:hypothetical protein
VKGGEQVRRWRRARGGRVQQAGRPIHLGGSPQLGPSLC